MLRYGNKQYPWLRKALNTVTLSGCLAMVFIAGTMSPVFTEFMRSMGANEFQFGLLTGLPLVMFLVQFVAAFLNNRLRYRKPLFMTTLIASRLLYIPIALLPHVFTTMDMGSQIWIQIALVALSAALMQLGVPLYFAWMADLVPRRILNRYWGGRQRWMYLAWSASFVSVMAFSSFTDFPITVAYPIIVVVAVFAGVLDILLFLGIPEPPNTLIREVSFTVLFEPIRDKNYRFFVLYAGARWAAICFTASFVSLYALQELGLSVAYVTFAWCMHGIGVAVSAGSWGRLVERHGHRPILILSMCGKPGLVLVLLLLTPDTAMLGLPVAMFFDSILNSGMLVASNGYMMTIAPQRNRSMFIAAISGLAGICGGLGTIIGGKVLYALSDVTFELFDRAWGNFHVLFAIGFLLRVACIPLARGVREPKATGALQVLHEVRGISPLQFLRFPIGLYRRVSQGEQSKP